MLDAPLVQRSYAFVYALIRISCKLGLLFIYNILAMQERHVEHTIKHYLLHLTTTLGIGRYNLLYVCFWR